ncbi:putative EMP1-like protein, partial [Plasmodium gaboni]
FPSESDFPIGKNRDEGKGYQFLRWITEWGEDFCVKQKKQYKELEDKCKQCTGGTPTCNGNCTECQNQCTKYQEFIKKWKPQYEKQKSKFETDKTGGKYDNDNDAKVSNTARDFLNK